MPTASARVSRAWQPPSPCCVLSAGATRLGRSPPVSPPRPLSRRPGLRCILDFLQEEDAATTQNILAEPPKYADGYEALQIDIHPGQFDHLAETHQISVTEEEATRVESLRDVGARDSGGRRRTYLHRSFCRTGPSPTTTC